MRSVTALLLLLTTVGAQSNQHGTPQKHPEEKEDVVRISVTLVQIDAVVTDSKGKPVTDLTKDDFEIYEDGRRQPITNFSYINTQPDAARITTASTKTSASPPPSTPPPSTLR